MLDYESKSMDLLEVEKNLKCGTSSLGGCGGGGGAG